MDKIKAPTPDQLMVWDEFVRYVESAKESLCLRCGEPLFPTALVGDQPAPHTRGAGYEFYCDRCFWLVRIWYGGRFETLDRKTNLFVKFRVRSA